MKKIYFLFYLVLLIFLSCSCTSTKTNVTKIRDLSYLIVTEENIPSELALLIESKKIDSFQFTYSDQDALYLCIGYGMQETSGYSIAVNELYLGENAIVVDTNLIGPSYDNAKNPIISYPFIVLKTELLDLQIIFD